MVGEEKAIQVPSEGLSQKLDGLDRISQLPDPLICQILSHLSTKELVKTSLLSTRWRCPWLWDFKLDSRDFLDLDAFVKFGDALLFDPNRIASCIHRLKFNTIDENNSRVDDHDHLTRWIDAAVKHKVQQLHVWCSSDNYFNKMPLSLCSSETLVSLELYQVMMVNANFVSLPCLKTMALINICYPNETTFEKLVSYCPVLEELKIVTLRKWSIRVFRVISRSLKKLKIAICHNGSEVVIDAPRLCCLSLSDSAWTSFTLNNLEANARLKISISFGLWNFDDKSVSSRRSSIQTFLPEISRVMDMTMFENTFKMLCHYSKLEPLPQFYNMFRLKLSVCYSSCLKWLPTFLECCPNLKSLRLVCYGDNVENEIYQLSSSSVPECLLSSLEFVEFKSTSRVHVSEMKLSRYLLENSAILKKFTLCVMGGCPKDDISKELIRITRRSTKCEVVVL